MYGRSLPTTMHCATSGCVAHPLLQAARRDALAAGGHQDLLLAPGDGEIAVLVERAQVAGGQPAVVQDRVGGLRVVRGSPGRRCRRAARSRRRPRCARSCPGSAWPTVPYRVRSGGLAVAAARRLGQAVALVDRDARAREEQAEPPVHRRAARHGVPHPAAHRRRGPCCTRASRRTGAASAARPTGRGRCPRPSASIASAYRTATSTALSKGPDLPSALGLAAGRVEDLLEDVRHGRGRTSAGTRRGRAAGAPPSAPAGGRA